MGEPKRWLRRAAITIGAVESRYPTAFVHLHRELVGAQQAEIEVAVIGSRTVACGGEVAALGTSLRVHFLPPARDALRPFPTLAVPLCLRDLPAATHRSEWAPIGVTPPDPR